MTPHDATGAAAAGYQQHDYRHQEPQQPGQEPQQPGHVPQRPAGWNDPYGQRNPEAGSGPEGPYQGGHPQQGEAPAHAAAAPGTEEEAPRPAGRVSGVTYPDLPDGRPQYGVRVTDADKQAPGQDGQQH